MSFRCGALALVGTPNVGKSSLLNRLVGETVAVVTPKPQTTRRRIMGIVTTDAAQLLVLDTPGWHLGTKAMHAAMQGWVRQTIAAADLVAYVVVPEQVRADDFPAWELVQAVQPWFIINQCDRLTPAQQQDGVARLQARFPGAPVWSASALRGDGLDALRTAVIAELPEGPARYPADHYTEHSVRFLVAELIRATAMTELRQELPYAVAVDIEYFTEGESLTKIGATLYVERESQKGMVIGRGGRMIQRIGSTARPAIEQLVGTPVFLELHAKVRSEWSSDRRTLAAWGLLPDNS